MMRKNQQDSQNFQQTTTELPDSHSQGMQTRLVHLTEWESGSNSSAAVLNVLKRRRAQQDADMEICAINALNDTKMSVDPPLQLQCECCLCKA